ncbi:hypothetical protein [Oharaeibacter diazotrophicus]|uniref:hypothetical protein n=1 Tax=Oharaeibacter diazotrophicus TaxID=1920512 RepID=UPI000F838956|nr:hypothetical protein [Oharaeibacter diazotrophicus]
MDTVSLQCETIASQQVQVGFAMLKRAIDAIAKWYQGEWKPYFNPRDSNVFVFGGDHERHWTAKAARVVVTFWLNQWQWIIGTAIAIAALIATIS